MREQMANIRAATRKPINLNFFCHTPPVPNNAREHAWREELKPYYVELGIDPASSFVVGDRWLDVALETFAPLRRLDFGMLSAQRKPEASGRGASGLAGRPPGGSSSLYVRAADSTLNPWFPSTCRTSSSRFAVSEPTRSTPSQMFGRSASRTTTAGSRIRAVS